MAISFICWYWKEMVCKKDTHKWLPINHLYFRKLICSGTSLTVKPNLAATSVIRPPNCSGHFWKVQTKFPHYFFDKILANVASLATSVIRPLATFCRTKQTKLMHMSLNKVASDWARTISDDKSSSISHLCISPWVNAYHKWMLY